MDNAAIKCVSVIETAAEKWVGLTRRIATIKHRKYYYDHSLVRHIYDIHKIGRRNNFGEEFVKTVADLLLVEKAKFKTHNKNYFENPIAEIRYSLTVLQEPEWQNNWNTFIDAMVFEDEPPSFKEAADHFLKISEKCIGELEVELNRE